MRSNVVPRDRAVDMGTWLVDVGCNVYWNPMTSKKKTCTLPATIMEQENHLFVKDDHPCGAMPST